jgi:formylglycine-generating enzyme required for sulfatase activity
VVTTVRDIEARAEPLRDAQQQRDAEQHLTVLAGKVASLRRAQAVRTGAPELELPALTADERALRADHLNARAWDGVAPWPEKRKSYGDEPRGVALARLALDKVRAGDLSTTSDDVLETLMWALFGVGQNQQARAIGDQAVAAAGASVASKRRRSRRELERAIRDSLRTLEAAEAELQRAKLAVERPTAWRFANEQDAQLHASLEKQVAQRDALERDTIAAVRARLAWHEEEQKLLAQHAPAWDVARTAVAAADDKVANRRYASPRIDLPPLRGLVPLGMNPKTRLHEFYHPRSAAKPDVLPSRGDDGSFDVDDDTGLIFVLVPGGTFVMGAQNESAAELHFDRAAEKNEAPVHEVSVAPFLLSRYEMTQAQWLRLTGESPSQYPAATAPNLVRTITGANPVERVSWNDAQKWLTRHGLLLPTEAQWEYACRAGTDTIWSCGDVPEDLVRFANLADITALGQPLKTEAWDDGHIVHAPVGSFAPNAFGCHDMHGNVSEWTLDLMRSYTVVPRPGDGLREGNPGAPVYRGGAWSDHATKVRSSQRFAYTADHGMPIVGVRPARVLR